jgi:hypothetical protein
LNYDSGELEARYRKMSDAEFSRIRRGDLVPAARGYYDRERRRRGLPKPEIIWPQKREVANILREGTRNWFWPMLRWMFGLAVVAFLAIFCGQALLIVVGFMLVYILGLRRRPAPAVLWLRRFNDRQQESFLHSLVSEACHSWSTIITLQDSTFRRSHSRALQYAFDVSMFGMLVFYIPLLFLVAILVSLFSAGDHDKLSQETLIVLGALFGLIAVFVYWRHLYSYVSGPKALEKTQKILQRCKTQPLDFIHGLIADFHIVACDDANWQAVVCACLAGVAAVLIDISDLTDNLAWELQAAFRVLPVESVVLAYACHSGAPRRLPEAIYSRLSSCLRAEDLRRAAVFFYAAEGKNRAGPINELRYFLARAVAEQEYFAAVNKAVQESLL